MHKKSLIGVLLIFTILNIFGIVYGEDMVKDFHITSGRVAGEAGEEVVVPITFHNVPKVGLTGCEFSLEYDDEILDYQSVDAGAMVKMPYLCFNYRSVDNKVNFLFNDPTNSLSCTILSDGAYAYIKFKIKKSASAGVYSFKLTGRYDAVDVTYNKIPVLYIDGYVLVLSETPSSVKESTIAPTSELTGLITYDWSYNIKSSAVDSNKSVIYFIDNFKNMLCSFNYNTNSIKTLELSDKPSVIRYNNGDLIVGFDGATIIKTYDSATLQQKSTIPVDMAYYDFVIGNDGFLYVSGKDIIRSFSLESRQEISNIYIYYENINESGSESRTYFGPINKLEKSPKSNCLYFYDGVNNIINSCTYDNGKLDFKVPQLNNLSHVYMGNLSSISPDGNYLFDSEGKVFSIGTTSLADIKYVASFGNGQFSDICFDIENSRFYTAPQYLDGIEGYNLNTFEPTGKITLNHAAQFIHSKYGKIICISDYGMEIVEDKHGIVPENLYSICGYVSPDAISQGHVSKAGFRVELNGTQYFGVSDSEGYFEINNVPYNPDGYVVKVSKNSYLARIINNVKFNKNISISSKNEPLKLVIGDLSIEGKQDGVINILDFIEMAKVFNCNSLDANYKPDLDLNMDGSINMADIILIAKNFNFSTSDYPDFS